MPNPAGGSGAAAAGARAGRSRRGTSAGSRSAQGSRPVLPERCDHCVSRRAQAREGRGAETHVVQVAAARRNSEKPFFRKRGRAVARPNVFRDDNSLCVGHELPWFQGRREADGALIGGPAKLCVDGQRAGVPAARSRPQEQCQEGQSQHRYHSRGRREGIPEMSSMPLYDSATRRAPQKPRALGILCC